MEMERERRKRIIPWQRVTPKSSEKAYKWFPNYSNANGDEKERVRERGEKRRKTKTYATDFRPHHTQGKTNPFMCVGPAFILKKKKKLLSK